MPKQGSHTTTLRIMETSDVHGQLLSYDYFAQAEQPGMGLLATAELIQQARAEQPLHVLIENGDLIQGSALTDWAVAEFPITSSTHPVIRLLNALQYDVANLGNHEFNFGLDYLAHTYRDAEFPVISSNLNLLQNAPDELQQRLRKIGWVKREVATDAGQSIPLKIAVIGVLPPQIMQWDQQHLEHQVTVNDILTSAQAAALQARDQGADVVVLAAHTGMPKDTANPENKEQTGWLLAGISDIDAILLGHQHEIFPGTEVYDLLPEVDSSKGTVRGVPAVQPGVYGSHLGLIDLQLTYDFAEQRWQVSDFVVESRPVTEQGATNPRLLELVADAHQATLQFVEQPVGQTAQPLSYKTARWRPSSAVQFVQRAQAWQAEQLIKANDLPSLPLLSAAAPFDAAYAAEESATHIAAGEITRGAIGDLYRYPNTLDVVKVNGAQLRAWLERSAESFTSVANLDEGDPSCWELIDRDVPHYNFDTILGVSYAIDVRKAVGQRIVELSYAGQVVSDDQEFYVATNNYRANGGGNFPHLDGQTVVARGADMLADVLLGYIGSLPERRYTKDLEQHWKVIGIGCGGRI
ncbi:bifunctional 2',3'-cyclic-nucleotide 2'-phosphodiesterase/3'-nucleotidase [Pseudidiomarina sp. 1APR75-33.1]|uniref:bifunctional 2',3'-cyclic-nucleotide 2'-phosphodiesterase/3'-nucleotidase n=1 Tax=Pseudidiomarina terrestris TaxID=2820060 RepID=UPI00264B7545|nr:bifunctional 2',3'-cyclic-nucleotide 2'-phosphodiesterase/3'-nucleotidase [Pseudidiomarina sp. 1APR75-33.1]MDN7126515.1 bifunctional 2',3'-cyclic-nucleotide 2'-phosphodiesterase/3'-nucleotidase [Pseudidiomarina sp. 1APR75-33.1]